MYLIVKSHGGDAYSAVRIIKCIRTRYKTIVGVIPDYAYSAATLMLLGTNKLLVSPEGYIGPIDKPMEHGVTGESISALDVTQSISNLASLVSQHARLFYEDLRGSGSTMQETISKKDALEISWKSAVELAQPLVEKIDPVLLQKAYRDLRIGTYYGRDLLNDCMIQDKKQCLEIARQLVSIYPSHGYAIFRAEMRKLGLVVEDFENCQDQNKIMQLYRKQTRLLYLLKTYMLDYSAKPSSKQSDPTRNQPGPSEFIKRSEDITSRWITGDIQPSCETQENQKGKPPLPKQAPDANGQYWLY